MTPLVILALVVTLALLAPLLGTDSRDLAGRGNRGDHPLSPDDGTAATGGRPRHVRRHLPRF